MTNDVKLTFAGDTDKLERAFQRVADASRRMEDKVDGVSRGLRRLSSDGDHSSRILAKVSAGSLAAGLAVASLATDLVKLTLTKAIDFFNDSADAASNLNESMNAVSVVFKANADEVEAWYDRNQRNLGLSKRAFNELITPLGAMLKNAGLNMKQVTGITQNLTQRAADMASVFNTDVSDALEAIQAGLRGESDPLERYGVGLSAAAVQAEALAMTHKKSAKELTNQELALARVSLIMKQTADTAGDFAKTSGEVANSSRNQAAELENLQAKIGQGLLPVMLTWNQAKLAIVDTIANHLLPKLQDLWSWLSENVVPIIRDELLKHLIDLWNKFKNDLAPAIAETIEKAKGLRDGFEDLVKSTKNLTSRVSDLYDALGDLKGVFKGLGLVAVTSLAGGLLILNAMIGAVSGLIWLITRLIELVRKIPNIGALAGLGPLGLIDLAGRAAGGPVQAGTPYMVGEEGPELFVPNQSGMILPSGRGVAPSGSSGTAVIRLELGGDRALVELFKRLVTVYGGGDVQVAFGES